jgi:membrane-bound serine protease (ClpP class)
MSEYLSRHPNYRHKTMQMLIFQLNTPGGALVTMNEMVQTILASPVPVIVYVSPRGGCQCRSDRPWRLTLSDGT